MSWKGPTFVSGEPGQIHTDWIKELGFKAADCEFLARSPEAAIWRCGLELTASVCPRTGTLLRTQKVLGAERLSVDCNVGSVKFQQTPSRDSFGDWISWGLVQIINRSAPLRSTFLCQLQLTSSRLERPTGLLTVESHQEKILSACLSPLAKYMAGKFWLPVQVPRRGNSSIVFGRMPVGVPLRWEEFQQLHEEFAFSDSANVLFVEDDGRVWHLQLYSPFVLKTWGPDSDSSPIVHEIPSEINSRSCCGWVRRDPLGRVQVTLCQERNQSGDVWILTANQGPLQKKTKPISFDPLFHFGILPRPSFCSRGFESELTDFRRFSTWMYENKGWLVCGVKASWFPKGEWVLEADSGDLSVRCAASIFRNAGPKAAERLVLESLSPDFSAWWETFK